MGATGVAMFSQDLCVTIANTIPAHASSIFNSAWNLSMSEVLSYLNATHILTATTSEELKDLILEFLNTNLTILEPGSTAMDNPCTGSIPTTTASYCP